MASIRLGNKWYNQNLFQSAALVYRKSRDKCLYQIRLISSKLHLFQSQRFR